MEVVETFVIEELMDSESQCAADAEYSAESSCARAQMCLFAQELHCVTFLLQWVCLGVGGAVDLECIGLHLACLTLAHRFYQLAGNVDRRSGGNGLEIFVAEAAKIEDYLQIAHGRAVVESHKLYVFVASACAHPAFDIHLGAYQLRGENIGYLSSFHRKMSIFIFKLQI